MKSAVLIAALLFSTAVHADEASKREKLGRVAAVHGLEKVFQQQLTGLQVRMEDLGLGMISANATRVVDDQKREQLLKRFLDDIGNMINPKALVDVWATEYGKNLTEADVDAILAYHNSAVGKKEGLAAQAGMLAAMKTLGPQTEQGTMAALEKLKSEIELANKK